MYILERYQHGAVPGQAFELLDKRRQCPLPFLLRREVKKRGVAFRGK